MSQIIQTKNSIGRHKEKIIENGEDSGLKQPRKEFCFLPRLKKGKLNVKINFYAIFQS